MSNNRKGPPPGVATTPTLPDSVLKELIDGANRGENNQTNMSNENPVYDSEAFSVVRINKVYKVIRIPFNKKTLQTGIPEVTYEDTSRWETQAHFGVQTDTSFLMNEEEDFDK